MLQVIKRSGVTEPFDEDKLRRCLAATSDEAGIPFNKSDLNAIIIELKHILAQKTVVHTRCIHVILAGLLYTMGFFKYADVYVRHPGNAWKPLSLKERIAAVSPSGG